MPTDDDAQSPLNNRHVTDPSNLGDFLDLEATSAWIDRDLANIQDFILSISLPTKTPMPDAPSNN